MADRIVFSYPEMGDVVSKLRGYAQQYEQAADTFRSAIQTATASWEGASKDKFTQLVESSVYQYMHTSVPEMVKGLATLLEGNATTMTEADQQIAQNIPDSI